MHDYAIVSTENTLSNGFCQTGHSMVKGIRNDTIVL